MPELLTEDGLERFGAVAAGPVGNEKGKAQLVADGYQLPAGLRPHWWRGQMLS